MIFTTIMRQKCIKSIKTYNLSQPWFPWKIPPLYLQNPLFYSKIHSSLINYQSWEIAILVRKYRICPFISNIFFSNQGLFLLNGLGGLLMSYMLYRRTVEIQGYIFYSNQVKRWIVEINIFLWINKYKIW